MGYGCVFDVGFGKGVFVMGLFVFYLIFDDVIWIKWLVFLGIKLV